jgi:methylthioribulose-1-phosphate dehydratase
MLLRDEFADVARALIETGRRLDHRGLAPATAGNFSVRLSDGSIALTVSGAHKGRLGESEIMRVSETGAALDGKKPSAETLLHCLIYEALPGAGAVLHTHSVAGTVLSLALREAAGISLAGYEMLKVYPGVTTHETSVTLPLVENSQDMPALAERLRPLIEDSGSSLPAFYIRGHGLYAWGPTLAAAENIVEGSEFLLACEWERYKAEGRGA